MKTAEKWVPIIDPDRCSGCAVCVNLCAPACLGIPLDRAVLEHAADCKSEGRCVRACPQGAIEMAWLPFDGERSRGRWRTSPVAVFERLSRSRGRLCA